MLIAGLALLAGVLDRLVMAVVVFVAASALALVGEANLFGQYPYQSAGLSAGQVAAVASEYAVIVMTGYLVGFVARTGVRMVLRAIRPGR